MTRSSQWLGTPSVWFLALTIFALSGCEDPVGLAGEAGMVVFESGGIRIMEIGGGSEPLIEPHDMFDFSYSAPAWSPDGRQVAYLVWNGSNAPLFSPLNSVVIQPVNGGRDAQRTVGKFGYRHGPPAWSPDGAYLTFSVYDDTEREQSERIVFVPMDGSPAFSILGPLADYFAKDPAWSPDSHRLALVLNGRLMTASRTGEELQQLTPDSISAADPDWSPDGEWIAFTRVSSPSVLYLVRPDGTDLRRLDGTVSGSSPSWSPSGDRIMFSHTTVTEIPNGTMIERELAVLTIRNGQVDLLGILGDDPDWRR